MRALSRLARFRGEREVLGDLLRHAAAVRYRVSFAVDEGWSPGDGAIIAGGGSAASDGSDGSIDVAALSLCAFRSVETAVGNAVRVAGALFPWPRAMETAWEAFASVLPSEGRWWLTRLA